LRELALHILDIAENSISARASQIEISIDEDLQEDVLNILIKDNGKGMSPETLEKITDPFVTSRTTRKVGLGIPFFKAAAEACEGALEIESQMGVGTAVQVCFKHSHIDRMPLGDISSTLLSLIIGTPEVNWIYKHTVNDKQFIFDDQPIKDALDGLSLCEPEVMKFIREMLQEGIHALYQSQSQPIISEV
jgi:hypothetical protein